MLSYKYLGLCPETKEKHKKKMSYEKKDKGRMGSRNPFEVALFREYPVPNCSKSSHYYLSQDDAKMAILIHKTDNHLAYPNQKILRAYQSVHVGVLQF